MSRRVVQGVLVVLMAMFAALVIPAGSAQACVTCGSGGGGGGYVVQARVTFSGDAAPGGGGTVTMGVPATCWWEQYESAPTDPTQWEQWYEDTLKALGSGSEVAGFAFEMGDVSRWKEAAARAAATHTPLRVYYAKCLDNATCQKLAAFVGGPTKDASVGYGKPCPVPLAFNFFAPGAEPAPQVDPEQLALLARDRMVIGNPNVDRNPKVGDLGGATLVALPTYFWVTNPLAVGGVGGHRTITARVGPVFATVVATTDGLVLYAPSGDGAQCPPAQAIKAYSAGIPGGCSVTFTKASVGYPGGYPVTATTTWGATWTGTGQPAPQAIDGPVGGNATVNVPVAESQAITTGSR